MTNGKLYIIECSFINIVIRTRDFSFIYLQGDYINTPKSNIFHMNDTYFQNISINQTYQSSSGLIFIMDFNMVVLFNNLSLNSIITSIFLFAFEKSLIIYNKY